jgi:hypothetical protein
MSETTVEERIVALESKVEELNQCYKDVAYEYLNNLVKRIETIRDEVNKSIRGVEEHLYAEAFGKIAEAVEDSHKSLSHEAIAKSVIPALTDGSHVLVNPSRKF